MDWTSHVACVHVIADCHSEKLCVACVLSRLIHYRSRDVWGSSVEKRVVLTVQM